MPCRIIFTLTLLVLYVQINPALTECNLNCPNGRVKDASGCETCECIQVCGPDRCAGMRCSYGREMDQNGCITCSCRDPCNNFFCPSGQTCTVQMMGKTYAGKCVATVTTPSCDAVSCGNTCRYGFKSDQRGCHTCVCLNPCENRRCGQNQRCVIEHCAERNDCLDYTANCVDIGAGTLTNPLPQPPGVKPTEDSRQTAAMRECCATASLSGTCLQVCLSNSSRLLSDFGTCFPYPQIFAYLRCISVSRAKETIVRPSGPQLVVPGFQPIDDIRPTLPDRGNGAAMDNGLQAALLACCASANLIDSCYSVCLKTPQLMLAEFAKCLPYPKVLDYMRCVSDFGAKQNPLNQQLGPHALNIFLSKRKNKRAGADKNATTAQPKGLAQAADADRLKSLQQNVEELQKLGPNVTLDQVEGLLQKVNSSIAKGANGKLFSNLASSLLGGNKGNANRQGYGQGYGQRYDQGYGQQYDQGYGQRYDQGYGQQYDQRYGQRYDQPINQDKAIADKVLGIVDSLLG